MNDLPPVQELTKITIIISKSLLKWYEDLVSSYDNKNSASTVEEHIAELILHSAERDCYLGRNKYIMNRLICKKKCGGLEENTQRKCVPCRSDYIKDYNE